MAEKVSAPVATVAPPAPLLTNSGKALLQRKCVCGETMGAEDKCEECKKKEGLLQRRSFGGTRPPSVPPIVHEVLGSPGQPLDRATRAFFEPRFGHDFSKVRVHTDARASDSAGALSATAYTVGHDVVFGAGRFQPWASSGKRLLAHELTHVIQQKGGNPHAGNELAVGTPDDRFESEADRIAETAMNCRLEPVRLTNPVQMVSRQTVCDRQSRDGPDNDGRKIKSERVVTAAECKRRAVTLTTSTAGVREGPRPYFEATLCRGDVEAGASGELDFSGLINQFNNFISGLPGAAGGVGGLEGLARRTLGSAAARANVQFVLRVNTFRAEITGRGEVSAQSASVEGDALLRYTNGRFRIEGRGTYDRIQNLLGNVGSSEEIKVTLGTDIGPVEVRLEGRRALSSNPGAAREDLTFDGSVRYRTSSGAIGAGVNVEKTTPPSGQANTQVIFSLRFEFGGQIPQEKSPDCFECHCDVPKIDFVCTAQDQGKPPDKVPQEFVPLFFVYEHAIPRQPEFGNMLNRILMKLRDGYTIRAIEGMTSPEGRKGPPKTGQRFEGNIKLADERGSVAHDTLAQAIQRAISEPGIGEEILRDEVKQKRRHNLERALAGLPASVGRVPAEMFGDYPSGKEVEETRMFEHLSGVLKTPSAGGPDILEQQHVIGSSVPEEVRGEAEQGVEAFRTGRKTDARTKRKVQLSKAERLQALYPLLRRALITLDPPRPDLGSIFRFGAKELQHIVGDNVPCRDEDRALFKNVPIPKNCLVDHCTQNAKSEANK